MKLFFRKLHRWLGLLMALQIIAWMGSGLYFAIFPIETIRGEHLTNGAASLSSIDLEELITPSTAWKAVSEETGPDITPLALSVVTDANTTWYRVSGSRGKSDFTRYVNGRTGTVREFLSRAQIKEIAVDRLAVDGVVESINLLEESKSGGEYRGRELPIWQVVYSKPESLKLYISGWTGEIVARRTTRWRIFDFLWMLHIMDFEDRSDFNTPLLQIAAALGLLVALSGLIFWAMTTRLFRPKRSIDLK